MGNDVCDHRNGEALELAVIEVFEDLCGCGIGKSVYRSCWVCGWVEGEQSESQRFDLFDWFAMETARDSELQST
jgi:hypothetical protein